MSKWKTAGRSCVVVLCACAGMAALSAVRAATNVTPPVQGSSGTSAAPSRLEDYQLVALSPGEGVAVLRTAQRQLITLRLGGTLPAAKARLVQVLGDRVRFETADEQGQRQTAWIVRGSGPGQPDEVQRVSAVAPSRPASPASSALLSAPLPIRPASK